MLVYLKWFEIIKHHRTWIKNYSFFFVSLASTVYNKYELHPHCNEQSLIDDHNSLNKHNEPVKEDTYEPFQERSAVTLISIAEPVEGMHYYRFLFDLCEEFMLLY